MLFMRYGEEVERELHVPLGPLYLTRALEDAGFAVDFRDYQCVDSDEPFDMEVFLDFLHDPAPVIGLSCMANLLPFTILAMRAIRARYPDRALVLGGVGTKAVEEKLLARFPWINIICRGEAERTAPELLRTIQRGGDLAAVAGLSFRTATATSTHTPDRAADHRPRLDPLPRLREGGPVALQGLRDDDQPRLPLPLHVLLRGPGLEPGKLQPQPAEHRRRDGVPQPRGRAWTCSSSRTSSSSPASGR